MREQMCVQMKQVSQTQVVKYSHMKTICITPKAVAKNCKYDKYGDFSNKDAQ
jgi:ribosomal protein S17